jgi:hypothetical protein
VKLKCLNNIILVPDLSEVLVGSYCPVSICSDASFFTIEVCNSIKYFLHKVIKKFKAKTLSKEKCLLRLIAEG